MCFFLPSVSSLPSIRPLIYMSVTIFFMDQYLYFPLTSSPFLSSRSFVDPLDIYIIRISLFSTNPSVSICLPTCPSALQFIGESEYLSSSVSRFITFLYFFVRSSICVEIFIIYQHLPCLLSSLLLPLYLSFLFMNLYVNLHFYLTPSLPVSLFLYVF